LLQLLEEKKRRTARSRIKSLYPDEGPYRRDLYTKHLEFFAAGDEFNERALLGGNRSGKTLAGAYETTCHLTGKYPRWWRGKRFEEPVDAWCAGDTARTVRDILQKELLGPPGDSAAEGTGMIPGDLIIDTSVKHGLSDCVEAVRVKHAGGNSVLHFKSYDQGRQAFQGTSQAVIWLDEECPIEIYTECLLRTMTTDGIVYLTATPLLGLTDLMLSFLPELQPTVTLQ
jgi:phage terminase large subunit-like protein